MKEKRAFNNKLDRQKKLEFKKVRDGELGKEPELNMT